MIGKVPDGWRVGFLNDKETNEIKSSGISKFDGNKNYLSTESIKNHKINNIEEVITYSNRPSRANLQPSKNDVFFARMQGTEKVLKITEDIEKNYILSTGFMPIKPFDKLDSNYLTHYLKSKYFNMQKDKLCNGGTQKALNNSNAEKINIPIPPLNQQEKIVKILDLTSSMIENQKELLKKYDLFLKSKFIEMFGTNKDNLHHFDIEPISKFGAIITGNTPSRSIVEYYNENFIEWIKTDNILEDKQYISEAKEYLSKLGMEKSRVLEKNGLLITCIAGSLKSIGNVAMTDRKITFNQQINAIQPFKSVNPFFLYWLIN